MAENIITNLDTPKSENKPITSARDGSPVHGVKDIGFAEPENESIIKVFGVGGGGNNAVLNMYNQDIEGIDYVICNTDYSVLRKSPPTITKIQLGKKLTEGLGAGCDPQKGKEAAEEDLNEIISILEHNTKMVFIVAGLGGGTGTGAAPIIAQEAKTRKILTVAIVTLPYQREGDKKYKIAMEGLKELIPHVDSLIVINNDKIYSIYPKVNIFDAWKKVDEVVATAAKSITEVIMREGYMNIDFADVKRFMSDSGMALMGIGKASGENRAIDAVKEALSSPLLNDNNINGAKNILVNISCSETNALETTELDILLEYIRNVSGGNKADSKIGVIKDESLGDAVSVTIIATGFPNGIIDGNTLLPEEQEKKNRQVAEKPEINHPNDVPSTKIGDYIVADFPLPSNTQSEHNGYNMSELEKIPAYLRLKMKDTKQNNNRIVNDKIIDDEKNNQLKNSNGTYNLKQNNDFADKIVD